MYQNEFELEFKKFPRQNFLTAKLHRTGPMYFRRVVMVPQSARTTTTSTTSTNTTTISKIQKRVSRTP